MLNLSYSIFTQTIEVLGPLIKKKIVLLRANHLRLLLYCNSIISIKVIVNYSLANSSLIGQKINAVMKVHGANREVLKTSSFPNGFDANNNGTTQLLTNIPKLLSSNLTTEVYFTTLNKSSVISNVINTLPHFENITTIESLPTITNVT